MTATSRICWDSCVIIELLQQTPGRIEVLREIVSSARNQKISLVVSALAIAEVNKCDNADEKKAIDAFFAEPFVHVRNVDRLIATKAAELSKNFGIKPPDAIHVATAIDRKCKELQTYDGCGVVRRRKHLLSHDKEFDGLRIVEPSSGDELPLLKAMESDS